jgi:N utilization substance protein A
MIIEAIESALQQAAKKSLGASEELRVVIDRKSFQIKAFDKVVATDEDVGAGFIPLRQAREIKPDVQPGETVEVEIAPGRLGRIAAQTARQMIIQKIRQAERENVFEEYKDRVGDIVSGTVRQIIHHDLIVEIGKTESILMAKERIPTEDYQVGDRIRAYVHKVQANTNGPAVMLSRACPEFVKALFRIEVAEIADGIVEVMGVARDPGFRSKIAVRSHDEKVDPVGACVGLRGNRVKNIVRELCGEKVDIVRWSDDIRQYITQALSPARLADVSVAEDSPNTVRVTVDADQLSLAIGRHGQNVRLAAKLTGWRVDIQKIEEELPFEEQVARAVESLAVLEGISREEAEVLVKNGFLTADGVLAAEVPYIQEVTGFDEATARRVWEAAKAASPGEDGE